MKFDKIYWFIALSIFLVFLDYFSLLNFVKTPVDGSLIPVKRGIFAATVGLRDIFAVGTNYSKVLKFYDEREGLLKKNEELVLKAGLLESENQKLRMQLEAPLPASFKFVPANVISFTKFMEIDQGESAGVKIGQIVVDGISLVGKVESVSLGRAAVKPVNDPSFEIAAVTSRGTRGIIIGAGENNITFGKVLQKDPLFLDDEVVTAGEEFVPPNLLVGRVEHITQEEAASYKQAKIAPTVDANREKLVFVITSL